MLLPHCDLPNMGIYDTISNVPKRTIFIVIMQPEFGDVRRSRKACKLDLYD